MTICRIGFFLSSQSRYRPKVAYYLFDERFARARRGRNRAISNEMETTKDGKRRKSRPKKAQTVRKMQVSVAQLLVQPPSEVRKSEISRKRLPQAVDEGRKKP